MVTIAMATDISVYDRTDNGDNKANITHPKVTYMCSTFKLYICCVYNVIAVNVPYKVMEGNYLDLLIHFAAEMKHINR